MSISRRKYLTALSIVSSVVLMVFVVILFRPQGTRAANALPITGYAWGSFSPPYNGIGWISFSGKTTNGNTYGVYEDTSNGFLSGYAWSSNYGWITFNQNDLSGCPSGSCQAKVNPGNGIINGWARVCSAFLSNCNGSLNNGTGPVGSQWDGWIQLNPPNYTGTSQLISKNGCWSGYAWGAQDVGVISFAGTAADGSKYQVSDPSCGTAPPTVTCSVSPTSGTAKTTVFTWSATPSGGTPPYTFAWSGNGATFTSTASIATTTYPSAGTYNATTTVTDSLNNTMTTSCTVGTTGGTNGTCTSPGVCVNSGSSPTASCSASPTTGGTSTMFHWTATPSGGTPPYTYSWTGTNLTGDTGSVANTKYSSEGAYTGAVTIIDKNGNSSGSTSCVVGTGGANGTCTTPGICVESNPAVTFNGTPSSIDNGQPIALTWSSSGAASCTAVANAFPTGNKTSGSTNVTPNISSTPLEQDVTYGITCSNAEGSTTKYTTVKVYNPSVSISASPDRVGAGGGTVTITWSSQATTNKCSLTDQNGNTLSKSTSGSLGTNVNKQSTFTISCITNGGQTVSQSITVNVSPLFHEF